MYNICSRNVFFPESVTSVGFSNDRLTSPRCPTPPSPHVIFMKWRHLAASVLESYVGLGKARIVQRTTAQIIETSARPTA